MNTIPVVDIFAGPGGLGEGFSAYTDRLEKHPFEIILSAEMDFHAHETLRLRAFYRNLRHEGEDLSSLLRYCLGEAAIPYDSKTYPLWKKSENEALCLELGTKEGDYDLYLNLDKKISNNENWILIGGPPCQAYSVVGRVRNKGNIKYDPARDKRHFLYQEYLKVISKYRPSVFVMENVRGMLSCKIDGKLIAFNILDDLANGGLAENNCDDFGYKIYSLSSPCCFEQGMKLNEINTSQFIVKSEDYGIPQTRHRVILLGVRKDLRKQPELLTPQKSLSVMKMLHDLPKLRSGLTRETDTQEKWHNFVAREYWSLAEHAHQIGLHDFADDLNEAGFLVFLKKYERQKKIKNYKLKIKNNNSCIKKFIYGVWPNICLNHESRSHMISDLRRYAFASVFAKTFGRSPKGENDFCLPGLTPDHDNWRSGNFADRFRVQIGNNPSTTITSHISKDGHYYIHPDPLQCRSLTVREAARLQTFPDDYYFRGPRTSQYTQVGNAVPPYLAKQIAEIVYKLFEN
jgi:DNA (cytosine-5)-methyltransferase 1